MAIPHTEVSIEWREPSKALEGWNELRLSLALWRELRQHLVDTNAPRDLRMKVERQIRAIELIMQ